MAYDVKALDSFWVYPTVADPAANPIGIAIAIVVTPEDSLAGSDVVVVATAGGTQLTASTKPDDGAPLPLTELKGLNAQAIYAFDNPSGATLGSIAVTIKGTTVNFGSDDSRSLPVA